MIYKMLTDLKAVFPEAFPILFGISRIIWTFLRGVGFETGEALTPLLFAEFEAIKLLGSILPLPLVAKDGLNL